MLTFSPVLMIVPLLLAALLCLVARMVSEGSVLSRGFRAIHDPSLRPWEVTIDFLAIAGTATFIMFIDEHNVRSIQIFVYGLSFLGVSSVALVLMARTLGVVFASVIIRKIAFRTIICLALFIVVLGMRAAGIGHIHLTEEQMRLHDLGHTHEH